MNDNVLISKIKFYLEHTGPHTVREIAIRIGASTEYAVELLHVMTVDGSVFYSSESGLWKARG